LGGENEVPFFCRPSRVDSDNQSRSPQSS
jgi:hypothetical protein